MKSIRFTKDIELVKSLTDVPLPNSICFVLYEDDEQAGVISLTPLNQMLWSPHIYIKEKHRGSDSYIWGKQVARHMKDFLGARKFIALTPYQTAKKHAEKIGFKYVTKLTKSIEIDNKLLDQYLLELDICQ